MRRDIKKLFIETPIYDDDNKERFDDTEIKMKKGIFEHTERINQDLEVDFYDVKARGYHKLMIRKNQDLIELELDTNKVKLFPKIIGLAVRVPHRSKGYSYIFYKWLINRFGGIISDKSLTGEKGHGSFQLWQKISKEYPTYIWKSKETTIIPIQGEITDKMMGNSKDHFISSKEPIDYKAYNSMFSKTVKMPSYAGTKKVAAMTEMPEFSDRDKTLGDDESFLPPLHSSLIKTIPIDVRNGKGKLEIYKFISNAEEKEILLYMPNGDSCAVMQYDATRNSDMPFPVVSFCAVKELYRGKGLSKVLYDFVIKLHKGIISDATLTGEEGYGSFQVWQSLNVKYKGRTYIINTTTGIIKPVDIITTAHMGNHNERFMVTLHPFDYVRHNDGSQLKEVEQMNHTGEHDIDSSDPNEWDFISGKTILSKKVSKDIVFIKMKVQHNNDVKYAIKDIKNKIIITGMRAEINANDFKVKPTEVQIKSVVTNPKYRRNGWGKLLYKLVLETEKIIVSDYQLYPGTYTIWKDYLPSLKRCPHV